MKQKGVEPKEKYYQKFKELCTLIENPDIANNDINSNYLLFSLENYTKAYSVCKSLVKADDQIVKTEKSLNDINIKLAELEKCSELKTLQQEVGKIFDMTEHTCVVLKKQELEDVLLVTNIENRDEQGELKKLEEIINDILNAAVAEKPEYHNSPNCVTQ